MRVFLSYGHDANEELVLRIKQDLQTRGHDVWFDKNEIKFGDDWRRSITDGITNSQKFVSFLSKYSTRDPGVCLDEIAIAIGVKSGNIQTILVESEAEVKPPPSISHVQWLDMHDWKARHAAGEEEWHKCYQEKLAEIIRVLESEESRRFAGEIEKLNEYLKPIATDSRIAALLARASSDVGGSLTQSNNGVRTRTLAPVSFGLWATRESERVRWLPISLTLGATRL